MVSTHLIQEVLAGGNRFVHDGDDLFDLVPARPLRVTGMTIDSSHILAHFLFDACQQEVAEPIERVREDELRPREDAQLVAGGVEVVSACQDVGWLVDASSPDSQLFAM